MKTCSKCRAEKPIDDFGADKSRADGKHLYCKSCTKIYQKALRKRHNEKRTQYNKGYRKANREAYNKWERGYHAKNNLKHNTKGKNWRANPIGTFTMMHLSAQNRARRKRLEYALSVDFIKRLCAAQGDKCALTGITFDYARTDEFHNRPFAPSIDRKDSGRGYTIDNVQITCVMVNKAKNEFRLEMFDDMCLARVRQLNGA